MNMWNKTNSTASPQATLYTDPIHEIVKMSVMGPFALIGLVGNMLAVAVIVLKKTRRTNNDIFLLNLACADFLYICFNGGSYVFHLSYFSPPVKTLLYCKIFYAILTVPYCAGIFTITAMSINRCVVILNPFKPKTRSLWIKLCVTSTWVCAVCIFLPFSILSVNRGIQCIFPGWYEHDYKAYFSFLTIIEYPLPLMLIMIAYFKIGMYLSKPRVPQLSIVARGNTLRSPRQETRKESIAMTKTVGAIVLLFAFLMLPLQIAMQAYICFEVREPWIDMVWSYGDVLAVIHSSLNPFLYTIRTPQYRKQISSWVKRQPSTTSSTQATQRSRCQSYTPSCATTEIELNGGVASNSNGEKQKQIGTDFESAPCGYDIKL